MADLLQNRLLAFFITPLIVISAITAGKCGETAGVDWWAFKPLTRPAVPESGSGAPGAPGALTAIDHFVIAAQRARGLEMSPEADRRTLIRRLYYDLIGLPPAPEAVESFVSDSDPDAYRKLVDGLLHSERYGERWARHWLDVIHYGDTHGYDKDKLRPNAWPYRDYVIRAFNEDKPYSRFVQEQLAGDVLWPEQSDGIEATGFIAAGPWDFIGHAEVPEEKYDGQVARHLDRDDMVATTMNAFCALTVQCAQCHDHKRDPVTMEDYYSLQAVFAALDRADRPYDADPAIAAERGILEERRQSLEQQIEENARMIEARKPAELVALEQEIAALEAGAAAAGEIDGAQRSDHFGYHSQVATSQQTEKWVQVDFGESMAIDSIVLAGANEYGFADFGFPHRFRVEASEDPDFGSPVVIADETLADHPRPGADLVAFDAKGVHGRYVRVTATSLWSRRHQGQPETNDWIFALGELAAVSGSRLAPVREVTALDSIEALPRWGRQNLTDGIFGAYSLAARLGGGDANGGGKKDRGAGDSHDSHDSHDEGAVESLLALAGKAARERREKLVMLGARRDALLASVMDPVLVEKGTAMREELQVAVAALQALPPQRMVYAGTVHTGGGTFKGRGHAGGTPRTIHVLARGDIRSPGKEVGAGTVPLIPGVPARFNLPENHAEGNRRVELARWIVHKDNPLTWRTIVNRVWLYHFGRGIVDSPNDFGHLGQLPTHPELLDWLAVEFRDGGQSMKDLHRLILNSAVYRQSSAGNPGAERIDAGNQFLWRMNRRKLEAEAVRDSVLLVAGKLDTTMFGPGFRDFVLEKPEHSPHYQYHKHDPDDPATHRRSVYRFLVRSQPQPFMDTLDCADPSLLVDKRNETLTALQALATLNNKFMVRMASHFASRIEREASDPEARIRRACRLALSRVPTAAETAALSRYAQQHGLAAACRVLLNLNEFIFVD